MASERTKRSLMRFRRFAPINFRTPSPQVLEFDIPGIAITDIDRTGNAPMWNVAKHFLMFVHIMNSITEDKKKQNDGVIGVAHGHVFKIHPSFYNKIDLSNPITITVKPYYLGERRITYLYKMSDKNSGEILLENERQIMFIDRKTGKGAHVPELVKEHFQGIPLGIPLHIPIEEAPNTAVKIRRYVTYSDYDHLQHVNTFNYIRWCVDAATEAALTGRLKNFNDDVAERHLESAYMLHYGEAFAGDKLNLHIWERPSTLVFEIQKELESGLSRKITYVYLKFYSSEQNSDHLTISKL